METTQEQIICPKCRSGKVKKILYGEPDFSKINKDDYLGGCVVNDDSPKYHCQECGNEWGKYLSK